MARTAQLRFVAYLLCAAVVATYAFDYFGQARRIVDRFKQFESEVPLSMSIDLSEPGTTEKQFTQNCPYGHGLSVYLDSNDLTIDSSYIADLRGQIVFFTSSGEEVRRSQIFTEQTVGLIEEDKIMLGHFQPLDVDDYIIEFQISNGAMPLKGIEQTVFAEIRLCGCVAYFPAAVMRGIGLLYGLIGIVLAFLGSRGTFKFIRSFAQKTR